MRVFKRVLLRKKDDDNESRTRQLNSEKVRRQLLGSKGTQRLMVTNRSRGGILPLWDPLNLEERTESVRGGNAFNGKEVNTGRDHGPISRITRVVCNGEGPAAGADDRERSVVMVVHTPLKPFVTLRRACMTNHRRTVFRNRPHEFFFSHSFIPFFPLSPFFLLPEYEPPSFTALALTFNPYSLLLLFSSSMSTVAYSAVPSEENGQATHPAKPHYPHQDLPQFTVRRKWVLLLLV